MMSKGRMIILGQVNLFVFITHGKKKKQFDKYYTKKFKIKLCEGMVAVKNGI